MINLAEFLMGREKEYPIDKELEKNAIETLKRVNALFLHLNILPKLNSGYRPDKYNKIAGGSPRSPHLTCEAMDIDDRKGKIKKLITLELLEKFDLYMEHPDYTKTWVHLQTRKTGSGNRIFKPY